MATTPRSGSWLLSDYLAQTGVVAVAREYFHVNYVVTVSHEHGLPTRQITADYIEIVRRQAALEGGMFATKLHWVQINQLCDALRIIHPTMPRATAPELIEASLPGARYVYLTRRDKARQAISMFRAMRSETWWQLEDGAGAAPEQPDPVPDFLAIRWLEHDLEVQDTEWRRYFEIFSLQPFVVVYEDLDEQPAWVLRQVLDWLGYTDHPVPSLRRRLARQAGDSTEHTLSEYLTIRDQLPQSPPAGWKWSFQRRTFGLPHPVAGGGERPEPPPPAVELSPL